MKHTGAKQPHIGRAAEEKDETMLRCQRKYTFPLWSALARTGQKRRARLYLSEFGQFPWNFMAG